MFGFLNSTILLAASAALIPLIIHLFSRRRVKVVEFSSLRHLKEMQKRQLRRLKIRQLLLLILRMLIILAVVLAFARPTSREGAIGSHAAVSAVVLFDNSASMRRFVNDGDLFEIARTRTGQLLETFTQSDQVCLVPLVGTDEASEYRFGTAAAAMQGLQRVEGTAAVADLQAGLDKAAELLDNAANLNKELYVVSDRQGSSLPETGSVTEKEYNLYLVDLPIDESDNLGIVELDLGGQLIQPGHDFDLVATVHNYSSERSTDKIASLFINDQRVAQTDFRIDGGEETTVRFTRSVSRSGFHSGYVELSDDRFTGDNKSYFSLRIPEQFSVLIVEGDISSQFISLALKPPASGGQYWSVKRAIPGELAGVNFADYDVVILAGAPYLSDVFVSRLKSYVRRGNSLFITFGGRTDIRAFNATWGAVTGLEYQEGVRQNFTRAGYYSIQSLDMDHPIFSVFRFEDGKPPETKFYTIPKVTVKDSVATLMEFTGGQPALVEKRMGRGKVITFTGPISPEYSDITGHGFFVPFVSRIAEYLAADLSALDIQLVAGGSITRSLAVSGVVAEAVELVTPDSSIFTLPPEEQNGTLVIRTGPLYQEGVYRVVHRGHEIDRFAVNIATPECNLASAEVGQFAAALGADDYRQLATSEQLADVISGFRVGREFWQMFLWAAVLLLAAEMLLGRRSPSEQ